MYYMKIQTNFSFLPKFNLLAPKSKDKKTFFNTQNVNTNLYDKTNTHLYDFFLSLRLDK